MDARNPDRVGQPEMHYVEGSTGCGTICSKRILVCSSTIARAATGALTWGPCRVEGIAEGKRIRKYFLGDFYSLVDAGTDPRGWMVLQYHRPKKGDGMVMAFRRDQSAYVACDARLREIVPTKGPTLRLLRLEIRDGSG
jgi:hypothetical protein